MTEVVSQMVRYVYLDVVGFTDKRSVEAQTDIIAALNSIVRKATSGITVAAERILFLPTGDGMGIAILDEMAPYDVHVNLALEILKALAVYNEMTTDAMRKFSLRIGISQNVDNVVVDINGSKNVAGNGISSAQRVMTGASGLQILISQTAYDILSQREKYMKAFRKYTYPIKHSQLIPVYQLLIESDGLSVEEPESFQRADKKTQTLSLYQAYYIAHTVANREFIRGKAGDGQNNYALTVLHHFLAEDSVADATRRGFQSPMFHIHGERNLPIEKIYEYYATIDFWVCAQLADTINDNFRGFSDYFEWLYFLANEAGLEKVRKDHPKIVQELVI